VTDILKDKIKVIGMAIIPGRKSGQASAFKKVAPKSLIRVNKNPKVGSSFRDMSAKIAGMDRKGTNRSINTSNRDPTKRESARSKSRRGIQKSTPRVEPRLEVSSNVKVNIPSARVIDYADAKSPEEPKDGLDHGNTPNPKLASRSPGSNESSNPSKRKSVTSKLSKDDKRKSVTSNFSKDDKQHSCDGAKNPIHRRDTSGYEPRHGKLKMANLKDKLWDDLEKNKELLPKPIQLPFLVVDDSGFIVNMPKSVVTIPNSDNVITNEVTHEKRFDSDGIPRRLIQRQSLKDSHTLETSQFISRDEIRDKSGTIEEVIEQEYTNDLETGHERLKVTIKNAKGIPNVTVEKNRIRDQDGNFLEKQEVLDDKSKVIRRSELVIQPSPSPLNSTLHSFTTNKTNYWLLYTLKRKALSLDILNSTHQIFLGTHNELIYSDNGRLLETLEIKRHPTTLNQPIQIVETLLKKDKKGFLLLKEELKYILGDFDGKITEIHYKKMGFDGEKTVESFKKKILYDLEGRVCLFEEDWVG
jgi:hypothetical protein